MHWIDATLVAGAGFIGYGIAGITGIGVAFVIAAIVLALGEHYKDD